MSHLTIEAPRKLHGYQIVLPNGGVFYGFESRNDDIAEIIGKRVIKAWKVKGATVKRIY